MMHTKESLKENMLKCFLPKEYLKWDRSNETYNGISKRRKGYSGHREETPYIVKKTFRGISKRGQINIQKIKVYRGFSKKKHVKKMHAEAILSWNTEREAYKRIS